MADQKISALDGQTTPVSTDSTVIVTTSGGSPANKEVLLGDWHKGMVAASATVASVVELATNAEVAARADTARAVTPQTLQSGIGVWAQVVNAKTADYTLLSTDYGSLVTMTSAGSLTVFVTTSATMSPVIGQWIDLAALGAGAVTVSGTTVATINATPGRILRSQYSAATLRYVSDNTWLLVGDLTA